MVARSQCSAAEAMLGGNDAPAVDVSQLGPRQAAKALAGCLANGADRDAWVRLARVRAIVGSIAGSKESALSGMRAWCSYHTNCLKRSEPAFPPKLDDLVAWSDLFRHPKTFGNYLSYVRVACELLAKPCGVFGHPSLKRAKQAIAKRQLFVPQKPMFVHIEMVQRLVELVIGTVTLCLAVCPCVVCGRR